MPTVALGSWMLCSCARMEPPPGGPPDLSPPHLIETRPGNLAVLPRFGGAVEFRFDEVVSEGSSPSTGSGTSELERLILLSPSAKVPDVSWKRSRLTVRPAEGWKPNRVYRVELLPGVTDLRRNRSDSGTVVTFTTGGPPPRTTLTGVVVDWSSRRPAASALVEATLLPDSLAYRARTDSTGRFSLGPLPDGVYRIAGILDQNRNGRLDFREGFDTVRLARGRTKAGELWAFIHDTTPPRATAATTIDSTAATVTLSQSLDPRSRFDTSAVRLRLLPDSSRVEVASVRLKPLDDSLAPRPGRLPSRGDSARAPRSDSARAPRSDSLRQGVSRTPRGRAAPPDVRDTTPAGRPGEPDSVGARVGAGAVQLTSRPPLTDQVVVRPRRPWRPGGRYLIELRGVRTLTGSRGDVRATLVVPEARRDSTANRAAARGVGARLRGVDSTRSRTDSTRSRTDSTGRR